METPESVLEELRRVTPPTAIPIGVRAFGFLPNFDAWQPGDLILVQDKNPDLISKAIAKIQASGYGKKHAVWTHAAVYLGDGLMLCEAQIDPPQRVFSVIVANCWNYFGTHEICLRRSRHALEPEAGWAIATAAATKIGGQYDWKFILKIAADRLFLGEDILVHDQTGKISAGTFVCSSLYSTAHAYATDVTITDKTNGLCLPAYLAANQKHFVTIPFDWRPID
jgi:hypothetical protein